MWMAKDKDKDEILKEIKELKDKIKELDNKLDSQKDWIQNATKKHKGLLKEKAEKDKAINENGDINLDKMEEVAEKEIKEGKHKEGEKLKKEVNLAKTLKKESKKKEIKEKYNNDWW